MSRKKGALAGLLAPQDTNPAPNPEGPPTCVRIDTIAPNPDNPRDPDELDLDELIESFREVGQLQPVVVVSRQVFLKHRPHHRAAIGDAHWVVLGGNRRLEAARALHWVRLDIKVRDDLGDDEDGLLDEAVMIENIHRKNLAPLKEAAFLQRLVDRHGSQRQVAKRIGKTQAYVSQRIALLRLAPELQAAVDAGELRMKQAIRLSGIEDFGEQRAAWRAAREAPAPPPGDSPVITPTPAAGTMQEMPPGPRGGDNPVIASHLESPPAPIVDRPASASIGVGDNRVITGPPTAPAPAPVVEPAAIVPAQPAAEPAPSESPARPGAVRLPWDNPGALCALLLDHMALEHVERLADLLRQNLRKRSGS